MSIKYYENDISGKKLNEVSIGYILSYVASQTSGVKYFVIKGDGPFFDDFNDLVDEILSRLTVNPCERIEDMITQLEFHYEGTINLNKKYTFIKNYRYSLIDMLIILEKFDILWKVLDYKKENDILCQSCYNYSLELMAALDYRQMLGKDIIKKFLVEYKMPIISMSDSSTLFSYLINWDKDISYDSKSLRLYDDAVGLFPYYMKNNNLEMAKFVYQHARERVSLGFITSSLIKDVSLIMEKLQKSSPEGKINVSNPFSFMSLHNKEGLKIKNYFYYLMEMINTYLSKTVSLRYLSDLLTVQDINNLLLAEILVQAPFDIVRKITSMDLFKEQDVSSHILFSKNSGLLLSYKYFDDLKKVFVNNAEYFLFKDDSPILLFVNPNEYPSSDTYQAFIKDLYRESDFNLKHSKFILHDIMDSQYFSEINLQLRSLKRCIEKGYKISVDPFAKDLLGRTPLDALVANYYISLKDTLNIIIDYLNIFFDVKKLDQNTRNYIAEKVFSSVAEGMKSFIDVYFHVRLRDLSRTFGWRDEEGDKIKIYIPRDYMSLIEKIVDYLNVDLLQIRNNKYTTYFEVFIDTMLYYIKEANYYVESCELKNCGLYDYYHFLN